MSYEARPTYFISRGNGKYTPMIPADELPDNVTVVGAPKSITVDATFGMISIGEAMPSGRYFNLTFENSTITQLSALATPFNGGPRNTIHRSSSGTNGPETAGNGAGSRTPATNTSSPPCRPPPYQASTVQGAFGTNANRNVNLTGRKHASQDIRWGTEGVEGNHVRRGSALPDPVKTPALYGNRNPFDALLADYARTKLSSEHNSDQFPRGPLRDDNKMYCSYWIRHGECDYTQQGCRFLHEFPASLEGIKAIGLRDYPRWFKQETAIRAQEAAEAAEAAAKTASAVFGNAELPIFIKTEKETGNAAAPVNAFGVTSEQANAAATVRRRVPRTTAGENVNLNHRTEGNGIMWSSRKPSVNGLPILETSPIRTTGTSILPIRTQSDPVSPPKAPYMCFYRLETHRSSSQTLSEDGGVNNADCADPKEKIDVDRQDVKIKQESL